MTLINHIFNVERCQETFILSIIHAWLYDTFESKWSLLPKIMILLITDETTEITLEIFILSIQIIIFLVWVVLTFELIIKCHIVKCKLRSWLYIISNVTDLLLQFLGIMDQARRFAHTNSWTIHLYSGHALSFKI